MDSGYRQLCSRCFNAEVAKRCGLDDFENFRFEPIGISDSAGAAHEFHFRTRLLGSMVSLEAFELRDGNPSGYQFQIVEVLVLRRTHGAQTKVVDRQHLDPRQLLQLVFEGVGGAGRVQLRQQLGVGDEQHLMTGAQRTVAQRLHPLDAALAGLECVHAGGHQAGWLQPVPRWRDPARVRRAGGSAG